MKRGFLLGASSGFLFSFWMPAQWIGALVLTLGISAYLAEIVYSKNNDRGKGYGPWFMALLGYFVGSNLWHLWNHLK